MYPSYLNLGSKEIKKRALRLFNRLSYCDICPRECKVNRIMGIKGVCGADFRLFISSYHLHSGEENRYQVIMVQVRFFYKLLFKMYVLSEL